MKTKFGMAVIICLLFTVFGMGCAEEQGANLQSEETYKPAGKVMELNDANFEEEIKEGVALVDFWAPWCPPCRKQGPIIEAVAAKIGAKAKVGKLNVDKGKKIAVKFKISGIPTIIIFKDGRPLQQLVGLRQEEELISAIEAAREK